MSDFGVAPLPTHFTPGGRKDQPSTLTFPPTALLEQRPMPSKTYGAARDGVDQERPGQQHDANKDRSQGGHPGSVWLGF